MVSDAPNQAGTDRAWQTKPTDRFVLKWIKCNLSARITPWLNRYPGIKPWHVTVSSTSLGCLAGLVFGMGLGFLAGLIAAAAQVLDGVDGQLARLSGRESRAGAFWDSVLDRYADGAMVIGMVVYLVNRPAQVSTGWILVLGALALIGSNLISYSSARATTLTIDTGRPTLASKGTRTSVMIICAWASIIWPQAPLVALFYLVLHPNLAVIVRLIKAMQTYGPPSSNH